MKFIKYTLIITFLVLISCKKKEINNPIGDWFKDPPVSPITQTIKTFIPVGYAASMVTLDMKGLKSNSIVKSEKQKNAKILYINTRTDYPYKFTGDEYGQMIVAYIQTDLNTALVSVFFTDMDITVGSFQLKNVIAFPVIYDEINDKTTAVYASVDINFGSNSDIGLDLTSEEITQDLEKLDNERVTNKEDVDIAVNQDAWIIDVYHNGTFNDLNDDKYKICGGQQAISVQDFDTESSAGALQMAMIDVGFSLDCIKNPTSGYVFMQDIEVSSTDHDNDIVFGHVFYEFTPDCDGRVLVDIATGNFIFAMGKEIDLGLN